MDERLANIEKEKQNAIGKSDKLYDDLLNDNNNLYEQQTKYAEQQNQILDDVLDKKLAFQEENINRQKEEAYKAKSTEDKKAKNDYTNFVNPYGNAAESMASNGLNNSGVSETSKLGGWNTYQNRLANSNKVTQEAIAQFDTAINEARLSNDVQKAENALKKLDLILSYNKEYINNKMNINQNKLSNDQTLDSEYHNRWQQEYQNIKNEEAREEATKQWQAEMAEKQRQYNENMNYQRERDRIADQQWQKEYALSQRSLVSKSSKSSSVSLSDSNSKSLNNNGTTIKTDHYSGEINPDCQYGTFSTKDKNGINYQPNNVDGNKLSQAQNSKGKGLKVKDVFYGAKGNKGADLSDQKIYTTGNRYYTWDGSINSYIDITKEVNTSISKGTCVPWGV